MASIARNIESFFWRGLQELIGDPTYGEASVVTEYFHRMHAMALFRPGESNDNFHPIAACTMASMMAIASCFFVRMIETFVPRGVRWEFNLVAKGGPCLYAASIIATAAYHYTVATGGKLIQPPEEKKFPENKDE